MPQEQHTLICEAAG